MLGYTLELHLLVNVRVIQMITRNLYFYKENQGKKNNMKTLHKHHLLSPYLIFVFLKSEPLV